MSTDSTISTARAYDAYPLDFMAIIRLLLVGAVAGALGWLLYLAITHYFIDPVFCRNASTYAVCKNGGTIAWITAHVIVLAAAVAMLARFAIYRPLLVVLAVVAALWTAQSWLGSMTWYMGLLWQVILFALAFGIFGWLARIGNFAIAVILSVIVVIASRLLLIAA